MQDILSGLQSVNKCSKIDSSIEGNELLIKFPTRGTII